jgi:hypothetical protein
MSTYTPIASQTLNNSTTTTVTFVGIPQYFTDLILVFRGGCDNSSMRMQFNTDTATNYSASVLSGTGSAANATRQSNQDAILVAGAYGAQTSISNTIIHIQNYANVTTYKTVLSRNNDASSATEAFVGMWRNTNAINTISLTAINGTGFWFTGSIISLYGVVAGGAKANGGNTVTTDGTYWYHTFTGSGSFTPLQDLTVDYLVVGGGGAGGREDFSSGLGGGGGAGGMRCTVGATGGGGSLESPLAVTANTLYPVIVGSGGAPSGAGSRGANGGNSMFGPIVSIGGGGGAGGEGGGWTYKGQDGGSGGGGQGNNSSLVFGGGVTSTGGSGTANQGFAGGTRTGSNGVASGGGGAGQAGNTNGSARGGDGVATSISGSSVTYAGGGGGASYSSTEAGGAGGGGTGAFYSSGQPGGTAGAVNTGSGGGGGSNLPTSSGAGGSGIVIVRYAV